jgi:hypothetical protein
MRCKLVRRGSGAREAANWFIDFWHSLLEQVRGWSSDHELVGWLSASNNEGRGSWAITCPRWGAGPAGLVPGIRGGAEPITVPTCSSSSHLLAVRR